MDDFLKRVIAQREREQFQADESIPPRLKYADDLVTPSTRPPRVPRGPKRYRGLT